MEKFDPNRELQVWQRVAQGPTPGNSDIRPLLLSAWESAAVFRHLLPLLTGRQRDRMKALQALARRSVEALKGIRALSGEPAGKLQPLPIPKEPARRLLEKSYHRSLWLMREYTARGLDPKYGTVYQAMADREREVSMLLAQLIGSLEK